MSTRRGFPLMLVLTLLGTSLGFAQGGPGPGLPERLAALKASLQKSALQLRTYQWVETTVVSLKGEVKSQKQQSCYYGADGNLQKLPISASPPPEKKRGLRGAIVAAKTEELTDTMKQAVALVKSYVPPDPALLERSKAAGKASVDILQPGKVIRLVFRDYQMPGDMLAVTMDLTTNQPLGLNVGTYLGQPSNPVALDVRLGALNDGTIYPADIQLAVKSAEVTVAITNTGYRKQN
jgi:hypothetical protein